MMLWNKEVVIQQLDVSQYYIDVVVWDVEEWRLTRIYGEPSWDHKDRTWVALRSLKEKSSLPWMVLGDLNEILYNHEKEGGSARSQRQLQAFEEALADCELGDMGFTGDKVTWQRGKIRERLDRGVSNALWNSLFPNALLVNGETLKSDHRPISVDTDQIGGREMNTTGGPKRFKVRWLKEETVNEIVHSAWARASAQGQVPTLMARANHVHADLHVWDREVLKKPVQRIKRLKRDLEMLQRGRMTDESISAQKEMMLQLELLLEQEEIYRVQRARANWLKHGDRNSSSFHHFASNHKRKNLIKGLVDDQGVRHEDLETMRVMVKDYFSNLFTSEVHDIGEEVLTEVEPRV